MCHVSPQDLKLMLEEQQARVAELSSALERERQMTRQQTDGDQVCEVSVSSELQVSAVIHHHLSILTTATLSYLYRILMTKLH